jgi:hypothetical protein
MGRVSVFSFQCSDGCVYLALILARAFAEEYNATALVGRSKIEGVRTACGAKEGRMSDGRRGGPGSFSER